MNPERFKLARYIYDRLMKATDQKLRKWARKSEMSMKDRGQKARLFKSVITNSMKKSKTSTKTFTRYENTLTKRKSLTSSNEHSYVIFVDIEAASWTTLVC